MMGSLGKDYTQQRRQETSKVHVGSSSFGFPEEEEKEDIQNESLKGTVVRKTAWWQWGPAGVTARGYQVPVCEEEQ